MGRSRSILNGVVTFDSDTQPVSQEESSADVRVAPSPSGDTTGATDTPRLQAFFDACAAATQTLDQGLVRAVFNRGTWYVNASLAVQLSRIHIEGAGCAVTVIRLADGVSLPAPVGGVPYGVFRSTGANNYKWKLEGMTIRGNGWDGTTSANNYGLVMTGVNQNGHASNLCIDQFGGYALYHDGGYSKFDTCWFKECRTGLVTGPAGTGIQQVQFENCQIERTFGHGAIAQQCTFIDCHVEFADYGIYNPGTRPNVLIHCGFLGNTTSPPTGTAVAIAGTYGPNDYIRCSSTTFGYLGKSNNGRDFLEQGNHLYDVNYLAGSTVPVESYRLSPQWVGGWYTNPLAGASTRTKAMSLNFAYLQPTYTNRQITIDQVQCTVQAAATAGGIVRMGIYLPLNPAAPFSDYATLVAETASPADVTTTGAKAQAFTTPVTIPADSWFFVVGVNQIAAATLYTGGGGNGFSPLGGGYNSPQVYSFLKTSVSTTLPATLALDTITTSNDGGIEYHVSAIA